MKTKILLQTGACEIAVECKQPGEYYLNAKIKFGNGSESIQMITNLDGLKSLQYGLAEYIDNQKQ